MSEQPRAIGNLRVGIKEVCGRSRLADLHQSGSMKCLFPRASAAGVEAVVLNTAGGVTGGDSFSVALSAAANAVLTVTTQACERAYRSQDGQTGTMRNKVRVADGARVNWLPQETILFEQSALDRRLQIDLEQSGSLLMVEPLIFGRAAMGETLTDIRFKDRIDIRRGGKPLFVDALRLTGNAHDHLSKRFVAGGAGAMALLVFVDATAEGSLHQVRSMLPETAGASFLQPDVLVARVLAEDGFELRQSLLPILRLLMGGALPRCWMI